MTYQPTITTPGQRPKLIKALLAGPTGSGKSVGATTLPGRKLFIDTDGRAGSLTQTLETSGPIEIITISETSKRPTALVECKKVLDWLWDLTRAPEGFPYDAVILDGLTSFGNFTMNFCLNLAKSGGGTLATGPGGAPAQHHYMPWVTMMRSFINTLIPLPCHVVCTCHYDMYEDKHTNKLSYLPRVYVASFRSELPSMFDETYICYREGKKGRADYFWNTIGDEQHFQWVKSGMNTLGQRWESPVRIDFSSPPVGFAKLIELCSAEEKEATDESR